MITLLSFGLLIPQAYSAAAVSDILIRLEAQMSGVKTIEADFIQEREMAVFSRPLVLKGKIFIQKPQYFCWHVWSPVAYRMLIKGNSIKQWDEETGRIQQHSLEGNPGLSTAIAQMQVWFSGAYVSLLKDYDLKIISQVPVILEFAPLPINPAFGLIQSVRVSFENDERYLRDIVIEEKNGDVTRFAFFAVKLNTPISPAAWELKPNAY